MRDNEFLLRAENSKPSPWRVLYEVLAERPFVTALLILQLLGASKATATTIVFLHSAFSDYVRGLPNAQPMTLRLIGASALMAVVAILWFIGAIGLWQSRPWAWWLVLVLNGLSATVSAAVQTLKWDEFLFDPLAMAAVVLLLIRSVRAEFRRDPTELKQVSARFQKKAPRTDIKLSVSPGKRPSRQCEVLLYFSDFATRAPSDFL
jgi:hypothetical protein